MRRARWLCLLLLLATPIAQAGSPGQRWWGVIVGVGAYPSLHTSLALEGPPNDVPLVLDWLAQGGVPRSHLTVLADGVPHSDGLPTRAASLAALAALPNRMRPDDIAFLYFAGHGSRQPQGARDWTKADGLDEIFLPRDVGRWDGTDGRVEAAIVGHEIGGAVDALRARRIFVWLVFDSCHSATGARATAIPGLRARAVSPEALGVPNITPGSAERAVDHVVRVSKQSLPGQYVAFYAAQTAETAPEMPLPAGALDRKPHGLFTYALLRSLATEGSHSYRDVAHRILAYYTVTYPDTTPEFEGALDDPIKPGPALRPGSWPAVRDDTDFHIAAGRLNDVTVGSVLTLSPALAGSGHSGPMALLRVRRATLTEAWASPVTEPRELAHWHVPADRSEELGAGVAQLVETNWDLSMRIMGPESCAAVLSAPLGCGSKAPVDDAAWLARARDLIARVPRPPGLERTEDEGSADLLLVARDQRMFVVNPRAVPSSLGHTASIDLNGAAAETELKTALNRATRVVGLEKLAAEFPGRADALRLGLWVRAGSGAREPLGPAAGRSSVAQGEELTVRLQNAGAEDLDVTILSIDEQFAITPVFPVDQESNRLPGNSAPLEIRGWAGRAGRYELMVISEEGRAGQPHDLTYLAQPGISSRQARQANGEFEGLLEKMGFAAPGTRGAVSPAERRAAGIEIIRYQVTAKP